MARTPRYALPQYAVYHVTARGVDRCRIYRDEHDYRLFELLLRAAQRRETLQIWAWCSMPNHYHAIIESSMDALSRAMYRLNGIYAQLFNGRHGRTGHLFQARFHAKVVETDTHLERACDYVWNNPVRAGLCSTSRDWPWSGQILRPRVNR
jgi:REP element-mobilizing transposase RayT